MQVNHKAVRIAMLSAAGLALAALVAWAGFYSGYQAPSGNASADWARSACAVPMASISAEPNGSEPDGRQAGPSADKQKDVCPGWCQVHHGDRACCGPECPHHGRHHHQHHHHQGHCGYCWWSEDGHGPHDAVAPQPDAGESDK